jgi:hypothetical protein
LLACYLDESGDTGTLPTAISPIQPLICILGLTLDLAYLRPFTLEFLDLKARFFPGLFAGSLRLSRILTEIKGADIRAAFRTNDHARRHHHIGFLDALLDLVRSYNCRIFGRVWIKPIGSRVDGVAVYTYSAQSICATFHDLLAARDQSGLVIADSRLPAQNRSVSFSLFTQKLSIVGDPCERILEMPTFGGSENHAGLQVCGDLLCSALVFPIAAYTYCSGYVHNLHVHPDYSILKQRYGVRLQELQHRYRDPKTGNSTGGLIVSDPLGHQPGGRLFR